MVGGPLRDKSNNHVVFKMTPDDYNDRLQRIPARGLELKEGRSRVEGKGRSIYCTILTIICLSCTAALCKSDCVVIVKPEISYSPKSEEYETQTQELPSDLSL